MMVDNALVPMGEMGLSDTMRLGETLAKSGYFSDAREAAQAVVKILAGRELGFGAIASMTGISIIKGQVSVGANLMAAAIKRDPRYDYRVVLLDADRCEIAFYQDGQELGRSTFSKDDAQAAGLMNDTWRKFTRNMLFARAMSNGARWYCPDACGGAPVYTPEELGAPVDGEGNVITVVPTQMPEPKPPQPQKPVTKSNGHPRSFSAELVKAVVDAGYAQNPHNAVGMMNLSTKLKPNDAEDLWLGWCQDYRVARAELESEDAAAMADSKLEMPEPMQPELA